MILTDHARQRLIERYEKWGLNIEFAIEALQDLQIENPDNYEVVYIDDIPIILVTDNQIIPTVYPHPVDMAKQTREYKNDMIDLRATNKSLYFTIKEKEKYIKKLERRLKNKDQKLRRLWK